MLLGFLGMARVPMWWNDLVPVQSPRHNCRSASVPRQSLLRRHGLCTWTAGSPRAIFPAATVVRILLADNKSKALHLLCKQSGHRCRDLGYPPGCMGYSHLRMLPSPMAAGRATHRTASSLFEKIALSKRFSLCTSLMEEIC